MSSEQPVSVVVLEPETTAGIRIIRLNRPEALNAMSWPLLRELHAIVDHLAVERSCRVIVLTGTGRGFCAGADLKELHFDVGDGDTPHTRLALQKYIASLVTKFRALPQPIIAAVNGAATGGGFALALASDIRILARSARFSAAFVRVGLSGCDIGVSWILPRLIGASRAFELLLTGRIIDADEADRAGLASAVVPDAELMDVALDIARSILQNSPMGVRMTKEVMWSQLEIGSMQAGIDLENRTQIMTTYTEDHGEATAAFLDRRPPEFADR